MPDRYTKIMLTVIAAALVALVAQNGIGTVGAQAAVQRVVICDSYDPSECARVAKRGPPGSGSFNFLLVSDGIK